MAFPDRNNPYNFDEFLDWRQNFDYYRDDPFIQQVVKHFCGDQWETVNQKLPGAVHEDPDNVDAWADKYSKDQILVSYCA